MVSAVAEGYKLHLYIK